MQISLKFRSLIARVITCVAVFAALPGHGQSGSPETLDRVVATVNNHAILASDVASEMRLSVVDPNSGGNGDALTPPHALQQLISRALIQQQIRDEDAQATQASDQEVQARLMEIRKEVPSCVRQNCASDAGWAVFLSINNLTAQEVENYLRLRLEILRFIEMRFRQGIRIPQPEIESYYRDTLLPQYKAGEAIPPLDKVSGRIEEILLQRQVNALFSTWLDNLRKQGDVEVLDPSLETPEEVSGGANQ
jgi:hypothetical protein